MKRRKASNDRCMDPLPCEIDNHADTTCFGKNFREISFTSEVCSVSPYLSEYDSVEDIPICTAATAVDLDSGKTIILEFGQGLWFGDCLSHSLINPNQCRPYGISYAMIQQTRAGYRYGAPEKLFFTLCDEGNHMSLYITVT